MAKLSARPKALAHEVFKKMFHICELINMDELTRFKIITKMTTERDLRNQIAYAKKEAIAEGRAEGLAEGRAEGRAEIARNLKAAGVDYAIISSATGLALEDVEQL